MGLSDLQDRAKKILEKLRAGHPRRWFDAAALAILEDLEKLDEDVVAQSERAGLATVVFNTCLERTKSFETSNIGADLSYLLGAICRNNIVEWERPNLPELYFILEESFGKEHPVWTYIAIFQESNSTPEKT